MPYIGGSFDYFADAKLPPAPLRMTGRRLFYNLTHSVSISAGVFLMQTETV